MALHVQGQVVRTTKASVAVAALERFRSRVLAVVAGEFVRSGEPPLAPFPRALVGLLACNKDKNQKL